ncbi:MAG: hypothetical protein V3U76_06230 [Granulosicoccus sp.]
MKLRKILLGASLLVLGSTAAHAELFGLLNGRSANPGSSPDLSVEGGVVFGDFQNIGARVNYRLSPVMVLHGDVGMSEIGNYGADADGIAFGVGVFYFLDQQRFLEAADVGVHASFHMATLDWDSGFGTSGDLDYSNLTVEALVSSKEPISENGMHWYANAGIHRIAFDGGRGFDNSDMEIGFGGGVTMPYGPGEVYAGIDIVEEMMFGGGFRYFLQ